MTQLDVDPANPRPPRFRKSRLLTLVYVLALVALVLSCVWLFLWSLTLVNRFTVLNNIQGYQPAEFTATSLSYVRATGDDTGPSWWAIGVVVANGQTLASDERLSLEGLVDDPGSYSGLAQAFPVGSNVRVMFNPDLTTMMVQGETLRLIPSEAPDLSSFEREQRDQRDRLLRLAASPLATSVPVFVVVLFGRRALERSRKRAWRQRVATLSGEPAPTP